MRRAILNALAGTLILLAPSIGGAEMPPAQSPDPSTLPSSPEMPDPLVMLDGTRVTSPEQWAEKRRFELMVLFQRHMYGWMAPAPGSITASVDREDRNYLGGKATKREVSIAFHRPETPKIHLLLVVPTNRTGPAPAFLGLNFYGNHETLDDPTIPLPTAWMPPGAPGVTDNKATDAGRGKQADVWSIEKVVDRGYALATFYCGDVAPDHPGFSDGVFPSYANFHRDLHADHWGAVAAWSWGLSRALDYLATDAEVDGKRVAVVGHSRLGKAALLAGAFDARFALTIAHQAGCGGSAPSRGKVGESVKQINDRFPHWFSDGFKKFNDQVDRLSFDQNCLVAVAAPRPVLFTNGTLDTWANPAGQFDVLKAADGVYKLLGVKGLGDESMPEPGKLVGDRLAYHIRLGKHAMTPEDWDTFLNYADKHLKNR
jgi:hypothetical protein